MLNPDSKIDLHTHSTASDGSDTPAQLVKNAEYAGLNAIALTDHDTISGLDEFMTAPSNRYLYRIPGVEFSCHYEKKEVHIVGLFIDPANEALLTQMEQRREDRLLRNQKILEKLAENGYHISEEDVAKHASGESVGRPHIARALIDKGYYDTMKTAFTKCLGRSGFAYIPRTPFAPADAISAIHTAGGLAVWAHPLLCVQTRAALIRMLKILKPTGLDGMETVYSMYAEKQHVLAETVCRSMDLLESGGSDYHGKNQPGIELGTGSGNLHIPGEFLLRMMERKGIRI